MENLTVHWTRKVILRGILKEPILELHPPSLQVMRMIQSDAKSLEESPIIKVSISAMATLEKLYETFVSVLNLNVPADYRVWKVDGLDLDGAQYPSGKLLADGGILFPLLNDNAQMSKTLEEAIVQSEDSFVVEVAVGGKWIVDANSVPKTPDIVTGTTYSDSEASRKEAGPLFKPRYGLLFKMQVEWIRGEQGQSGLFRHQTWRDGRILRCRGFKGSHLRAEFVFKIFGVWEGEGGERPNCATWSVGFR